MNEIAIVKRRTRVLPILLTLLVIAILLLAGLWMLGMLPDVAPAAFDSVQGRPFDLASGGLPGPA
jgi:hypothetical protein